VESPVKARKKSGLDRAVVIPDDDELSPDLSHAFSRSRSESFR
jgi:hypothetical protein